MDVIPCVKYYPWKIVMYNQFHNHIKKSSSVDFYDNETGVQISSEGQKKYTGLVNISSSAKIRDSILLLNHLKKKRKVWNPVLSKDVMFKLSFITLTLASDQIVDDSVIQKELLRPWLRHYQQNKSMTDYVWRAERQINGNIHYHVVSDLFQPYYDLLNFWNRLQSKLHFIDDFSLKFGHRTPNSIDIRQCKSDKELSKYLSKYISKESLKINGKVWDCSSNLHKFEYETQIIDSKQQNRIDGILLSRKCKTYVYDYCTVIYFNS